MSNFYDQASLVLVPSGYKDQKLYSQKPQTTDGQFLFNRGSDLEVTRVNSQGKIEKAILNGLSQSNTFSTTWLNSNSSETGGQADKDGGTTAWLLTTTSASGFIYQDVVLSGIQTFSVYAKAGNQAGITLYSAHASQGRYFNLSTGTVGGTFIGGPIAASITAVGGGWYRCSITVNASTLNGFRIYVSNGSANVAGTAYIQDAQLNYGLVAQTYVPTTTAAVISGLKLDTPRLNYDPANPTCPSLLLEPSRTNIIDQSEYIASWLDVNSTQESNYATSPEGVQNATRVVMTSATGEHSVYDSVSVTSGTQYTQSVFLKQGDGSANWRYFQFRFRSGGFGGLYGVVVDLQEGTIGYDTGLDDFGIEDYGNGWHRVWITATATTTSSNAGPVVAFNELANAYDVSIVGDTNADVLIYGAQCEAGSYPTSYIPTYGTSATRTADACSKTGISSLIGQTEGTIFVDFYHDISVTAALDTRIHLSSGTTANWIFVGFPDGGAKLLRFYVNDASGALSFFSSSGIVQGRNKMAFAYKSGDFVAYLNGAQVATNSTVRSIPTCSQIDLQGGAPNASAQERANYNQALVFKTRLSNADLATLTTL
jgi:hypothetical protein